MGWKERSGGRRYYYRNRKVNGRVLSEYVGSGAFAELASQLDEAKRQEAAAQREILRRVLAKQAAIDGQIEEIEQLVKDLVTAVLLATGHHQHKRQWRRERARNQS